MNCIAVIGLRLLVQLLATLYGAGGAGVFWLFGLDRKATTSLLIGAGIAWLAAPDPEDRARFVEFQRQRMGDS